MCVCHIDFVCGIVIELELESCIVVTGVELVTETFQWGSQFGPGPYCLFIVTFLFVMS